MLRQADWNILPEHLKWRTTTLEPGETLVGVLVGPIISQRVHWTGRASKPCRFAATAGKLFCPCQTVPVSGRTVGYVPLITQAREKVVVLVSAMTGYSIKDVPHGALLEFKRPTKSRQPLRVSHVRGHDAEQQWVRQLRDVKPHDVTEYLCHLWQDELLCKHCGFEYRPSNMAAAPLPLNESVA